MRLRDSLIAFLSLLTLASVGSAGEVSRIDWQKLAAADGLETGKVVTDGNDPELLIVDETHLPLQTRVIAIQQPKITTHLYTVRGTIRYSGVAEPGYLEMWSYFADGSQYFTRTGGNTGPMAAIVGTSSAREFILPFESSPELGPPSRLEINLALPAGGQVWIGPLTITEFTQSEWSGALAAEGAWWSGQQAGLVGGLFGSAVGIMGAIIGTLSGLGRFRSFCLGLCWLNIAIGIVSLIAGIFAVSTGQPYEVYFPLLLCGTIATCVVGGVLPTVRKRYEENELRRMASMDASVAS